MVQWVPKMNFIKKDTILFLKSLIKVKKMGKIPKKITENPNETQGICVVWSDWEEPDLLRSLLTLSIYGEVLLCYWVSISIRYLRCYIYTSFALIYIYVIYVAISIRYISVVSNIGCALWFVVQTRNKL